MRKIKVLLTACGCPGASTLIRMLKNNGEREVEIIGTDMDPEAIGRFLADKFYTVPPGASEDYIPKMLEIAEKEEPDVLLPESSYEVYPLALNKEKFEKLGVKVLVSDPEPIRVANNKWLTYETLRRKNAKVPLPKYRLVKNLDEFLDAAEELGYPDRPIVFKPPVSKGSRGLRIIDPRVDRVKRLLEMKPEAKYMAMEEFISIFKGYSEFPELLVMEYLEGMERTTDSICMKGRELLTTVKTVERSRWGVIVLGELVKAPELVEQTREILRAIPLSYCVNLQFIGDKLIEINPRVSSFIYQPDLIAPYLAIKLALGEITEDELREYNKRIDYGRRMVRYMDQVFYNPRRGEAP